MSEINVSINADFPVAGEDNDTQVFRDNFSNIEINLETAKSEITDLELEKATLVGDNNFGGATIEDAAFRNVRDHYHNNDGTTDTQIARNIDIDYLIIF